MTENINIFHLEAWMEHEFRFWVRFALAVRFCWRTINNTY
jgi:hypothetical protein